MKLRKWQQKALKKWLPNKRGIVKVVTGGGKTFFAIKCIEEFFAENHKGYDVLILVPSITLLDQWIIELEEKLNEPIDKIGGGFNTGLKNRICVCTYGSLKNISEKVERNKTLLICDECHKAGTERLGSLMKTGWQGSLGLSATPERDFDENFEEIIEPILGKIIYEYDYKKAHKDEIIADFELLNVYAPMMKSEDDEHDQITKKISKRIAYLGKFDKSDKTLKVLFFQRARIVNNSYNRVPTALKIIQNSKRNRWIIFSETIEQAEKFKKLLDKHKFRSELYHSKISPITRQFNLFSLKNGLTDILITCKSLDEGFDYPELDSAIILSSSSTSRQRIQRLGRVLRSSEGKTKAFIATIYVSDHEYDNLRNEQISFQENGIDVKWTKLNFAS